MVRQEGEVLPKYLTYLEQLNAGTCSGILAWWNILPGKGLEPALNNYNTNDAFYFGRGATYDPLTFFYKYII